MLPPPLSATILGTRADRWAQPGATNDLGTYAPPLTVFGAAALLSLPAMGAPAAAVTIEPPPANDDAGAAAVPQFAVGLQSAPTTFWAEVPTPPFDLTFARASQHDLLDGGIAFARPIAAEPVVPLQPASPAWTAPTIGETASATQTEPDQADSMDVPIAGSAVALADAAMVMQIMSRASDLATTAQKALGAVRVDVDAATTDVATVLSTTVAKVAAQAGSLVDTAATTVQTLSNAATTLVADTADTLADVIGSDIPGGLATLTAMVSAADVFGLPDIGDSVDLPLAGSLALADLLADVAPLEALLGQKSGDAGLLGVLDTDSDGLGLGII